jgi:hypothetical protein
MRGGACVCALWLGVLLAPAWSIAAPPGQRAPSAENISEAKQHYKRGAAAYGRDDFDVALREFTLAFEISRQPDILFNLGRVETRLGHQAEAIAYLERYLALKPDAEDLPAVQAEIDALRKTLAAQLGEQQARQREQAARDEAARANRATRFTPQGRAGIALTALGGAALVVGISLGIVALRAASSVESGAGMPVTFAGSSFASQESIGRTAAPVGIAFDVVGAAAAATGIGLLVWRRVETDRQPRARLVPTPGGLAVAGAF